MSVPGGISGMADFLTLPRMVPDVEVGDRRDLNPLVNWSNGDEWTLLAKRGLEGVALGDWNIKSSLDGRA